MNEQRPGLLAAVIASAITLIVLDSSTWVQLDVAPIFGLPLVLASPMRSRRLLWALTTVLVITTFAVYAFQIPAGEFALRETFFVNRALDAAALLLIAVLLHFRMMSWDARDAQAQLIARQDEQIEASRASRRIVEVQENERRVLANDLHDLVGQKLTALNINLNIIKNALAPETPIVCRLDDSLTLVEETIDSIRNVMGELRPAVLDDYGLIAVLRWYAEQFTRRTGIVTTIAEKGTAPRLPPVVEDGLFQITKEALSNVAKYARARNIHVTLNTTADGDCLTIADDGCGFDPAACPKPARNGGWGLMIMRERAAAIGAALAVDSEPGRGTRVTVTFPIADRQPG